MVIPVPLQCALAERHFRRLVSAGRSTSASRPAKLLYDFANQHADRSVADMNKMDRAVWALEYLRNQRRAIHEDFNGAVGELRGYPGAHRNSWYGSAKNILSTLYGFSEDFCADIRIPSEERPSPDAFEENVLNYRDWVQKMADELDEETAKYEKAHKVDGAPFVIEVTSRLVAGIIAALDYVIAKRPAAAEPPVERRLRVRDGQPRSTRLRAGLIGQRRRAPRQTCGLSGDAQDVDMTMFRPNDEAVSLPSDATNPLPA